MPSQQCQNARTSRRGISDIHSWERKQIAASILKISVPAPNICESCYLQLNQFMGDVAFCYRCKVAQLYIFLKAREARVPPSGQWQGWRG